MPSPRNRGINQVRRYPPPVPMSATAKLIEKRKLQFQELNLGLLARAMKPVDWPFNPHTPDEVRALQVEVMHKHYKREITPNDFHESNMAIRNLVRIVCPPPSITIIQGNVEQVNYQGVIIRSTADVEKVVKQGGIAYAATAENEDRRPNIQGLP